MAAPALKVQAISTAEVGKRYHLALEMLDPAGSGLPVRYGYVLKNDPQEGIFNETIDVTAREQLLTASPELIDRDLVSFPRTTQGDFHGGMGQLQAIDLSKYWDSNLDVSVPGYLRLRPAWTRFATTGTLSALTVQPSPCMVDAQFFFISGAGNVKLWMVMNGAISAVTTTPTPYSCATDGTYLYVAGSNGAGPIYRYESDGTGETQITSGVTNSAVQMWPILQGTNGWFLYYVDTTGALYKFDLTAAYPIAAASRVAVPFGANPVKVMAVVPWSTGVAILTQPLVSSGQAFPTPPAQFDVWYYDGANTTRMAHVDGYGAAGMCVGMGSLWVGATAAAALSQPVLMRIDSSSVEVVATADLPGAYPSGISGAPQVLQSLPPAASSHYVFWPVSMPSWEAAAGNPPSLGFVCLQYDILSGALSRLPLVDGLETFYCGGNPPNLGGAPAPNLAANGDSVATVVFATGQLIQAQILTNTQTAVSRISGNIQNLPQYARSGWLVTSRYDFNTPGISKLIRRVRVSHAPLNAGESIYLEAHVDSDPTLFTPTLGPSPATASVTNNSQGSTSTVLNLPQATIGRSMYLALQLNSPAPSPTNTSPSVFYVTIEISTPWAWKCTVDCTSQRKNLDMADDTADQGLRGKDLYWFLHTAWELAQNVTFYHPNGQSYTAVIEDLSFDSRSPMLSRPAQNADGQDFDSYATFTLRQEIA